MTAALILAALVGGCVGFLVGHFIGWWERRALVQRVLDLEEFPLRRVYRKLGETALGPEGK
jgi:membrane protein DedA with SNARE-associated domain